MSEQYSPPTRFLRIKQVSDLVGMPPSTVYMLMADGRFPKSFSLGPRCKAWDEREIAEWQDARLAARNTRPLKTSHPKKNAAPGLQPGTASKGKPHDGYRTKPTRVQGPRSSG